jgi:hypothetical protein
MLEIFEVLHFKQTVLGSNTLVLLDSQHCVGLGLRAGLLDYPDRVAVVR